MIQLLTSLHHNPFIEIILSYNGLVYGLLLLFVTVMVDYSSINNEPS